MISCSWRKYHMRTQFLSKRVCAISWWSTGNAKLSNSKSLPPVPDRHIFEMIQQDLTAAHRAWIAKAENDPKGYHRRGRSDCLV